MLIKRKCKKPLDQQDNLMKKTNGKQVIQELFDFAVFVSMGTDLGTSRYATPSFLKGF